MKNITLQDNPRLNALAELMNMPEEAFKEHLMDFLTDRDCLSDSSEFWGKRIGDIIDEKQVNKSILFSGFRENIGSSCVQLIEEIKVISKDNECPECGAELQECYFDDFDTKYTQVCCTFCTSCFYLKD